MSDPVQAAFADLQAAIAKEKAARKASDLATVAANDALKALGDAGNYATRCKMRLLELAEKPVVVPVPSGVEHVRSLAVDPVKTVVHSPHVPPNTPIVAGITGIKKAKG